MAHHGRYLLGKEMESMLASLDECLKHAGVTDNFDYELTIVGGAVMVLHHKTRNMSQDIDGIFNMEIPCYDEIKKHIGEAFNTASDWLNDDFKLSDSYTPAVLTYRDKMREYDTFTLYKVNDRLLLCMKFLSFRYWKEKKDIDDIRALITAIRNEGWRVNKDTVNEWGSMFYSFHVSEYPDGKARLWAPRREAEEFLESLEVTE